MTSPPEQITVVCPCCNKAYKDWWRPSINLSLGEEFDEEYLNEASSATCDHCGLKIYLNNLIVQADGTWVIRMSEDEEE
jgi:hypothetical protein